MPYKLHWTKYGAEWSYSGLLSGKEIKESNNIIYGDERFDDLRYQIVDLSAVETFDVSDSDMKHMAHLDQAAAKSNPKVKVAVIAPAGPAQAIADAYAKYSQQSSWAAATFETRQEAETWLGLRAD